MSGVWLKCDNCNKELREESGQAMQLAVRFKPSLFPQSLAQVHESERRHRCRSCGWVNVFVPAAEPAVERASRGPVLAHTWRRVSLKR